MSDELINLLGKHFDEVAAGTLAASWGTPQRENIEDSFYLVYKEGGISFVAKPDQVINTIHVRSEGDEGYRGYTGELPLGISFDTSQNQVRKKLGKPSASGGGKIVLGLDIRSWDRYDYPPFSFHLSYSKAKNAIVRIALARPHAVPR